MEANLSSLFDVMRKLPSDKHSSQQLQLAIGEIGLSIFRDFRNYNSLLTCLFCNRISISDFSGLVIL